MKLIWEYTVLTWHVARLVMHLGAVIGIELARAGYRIVRNAVRNIGVQRHG